MSRGGRGGGRGGKRGPDMSWDDEEPTEVMPNARKPGPLFPERYIPIPKPLTATEKSGVASLISIRDRIRRGPLYAVLDPTLTQSKTSSTGPQSRDQPTTKRNPRAGFDPFNDQEKYTKKYHRKRRTIPDLGERGGYTLRLFPLELWTTLDPKRRMTDWETLTEEQKARIASGGVGKRKKKQLKFTNEDDEQPKARGSDSEASGNEDEDDEDALSPSRKRKKGGRQKSDADTRSSRQKKGLDAEDDYPDVDQQDEDVEGGGGGEDEPADSEFGTDEDDDDGADDYNAEQYFDDGADEVDGFGDGDADDGGGGGYY